MAPEVHGGWGTLVGVRLALLLLADPERFEGASGTARALGRRHDVTLLAERCGAISAHLRAARAARASSPKIVHGFGARGFGGAAAPIARGVGAKYVLALASGDFDRSKPKKLARLANAADAVLLEEEKLVAPLRAAGMKRSVYILPCPADPEDDTPYLRGIEVVYGRLIAGEAEPEPEDQIVQIGGFRKSRET